MNEVDKQVIAEWSNINAMIAKLDELKPQMSTAEYNALVDKLYQRKRAVLSRLKALRPPTTNDLRWQHGYIKTTGGSNYDNLD